MRLFPLFHPAAALRTPSVKELLREDLAKLPALLEEARPAEQPAAESTGRAAGNEGDQPALEPSQMGLFG